MGNADQLTRRSFPLAVTTINNIKEQNLASATKERKERKTFRLHRDSEGNDSKGKCPSLGILVVLLMEIEAKDCGVSNPAEDRVDEPETHHALLPKVDGRESHLCLPDIAVEVRQDLFIVRVVALFVVKRLVVHPEIVKMKVQIEYKYV